MLGVGCSRVRAIKKVQVVGYGVAPSRDFEITGSLWKAAAVSSHTFPGRRERTTERRDTTTDKYGDNTDGGNTDDDGAAYLRREEIAMSR